MLFKSVRCEKRSMILTPEKIKPCGFDKFLTRDLASFDAQTEGRESATKTASIFPQQCFLTLLGLLCLALGYVIVCRLCTRSATQNHNKQTGTFQPRFSSSRVEQTISKLPGLVIDVFFASAGMPMKTTRNSFPGSEFTIFIIHVFYFPIILHTK